MAKTILNLLWKYRNQIPIVFGIIMKLIRKIKKIMSDENERVGLLTTDQQSVVEKAIKFKNPLLEVIDGPIIKAVDDVLLEKLMDYLEEKYPDITPYIYEGVDLIVSEL